jgi:hypothetical protein
MQDYLTWPCMGPLDVIIVSPLSTKKKHKKNPQNPQKIKFKV